MLWMNSKRTRRQATFSKSLLVMFIAQLLLSAACISTANADAVSRIATAHCHNLGMVMPDVPDINHTTHQEMPVCSHCDTPDMGASAYAPVTTDMVPVLLAVITLPEMPALSESNILSLTDQSTPQKRFSNIYQTTQRILI